MKNKPTIIGLDGGASKVDAYVVEISDDNKFSLGKNSSVKEYSKYPEFQKDFRSVNLAVQLEQVRKNDIKLTPTEIQQSKSYYAAFIDSITEIITQLENKNVLIGIGMPGIKSTDRRGIIAMANGPRMPNFATEIEQRLSAAGLALEKPIAKLGSDADYCGVGEEFAIEGAFRGVQNAYYLGGGTGAADALKLHGNILSFDSCTTWIAKTWEMSNKSAKSMEVFCSMNGIQSLYGELRNISQKDLIEKGIFLEQILKRANFNDEAAKITCQLVSNNLSRLLFERIVTLYEGWQDMFSFINANRASLNSEHDYKCSLFDKIIIGQRLGISLKSTFGNAFLLQPILKKLTELIKNSEDLDDRAKSHYIVNNKFSKRLIVLSNLREAPALGAGIDAYNHWKT